MFDKTNPTKAVIGDIADLTNRSIPKMEIFQQMKLKYPQYDQDSIAKGIASFIPENIKKKYRIHSYLLSLFVLIGIIFSLIIPYLPRTNLSPILFWIGRVIVLIIAIFFVNGFLRFKLFYYTTAVSLYSIYLLLVIYNLLVYPITTILLISQIGIVVTFMFLYLLRKQIFPNIGLWGNVLKENGNYKF